MYFIMEQQMEHLLKFLLMVSGLQVMQMLLVLLRHTVLMQVVQKFGNNERYLSVISISSTDDIICCNSESVISNPNSSIDGCVEFISISLTSFNLLIE